MQTISLHRKGFFYKMFRFIHERDPKDTCTYKRGTIISLILSLIFSQAYVLRWLAELIPVVRDRYNHIQYRTPMFMVLMVVIAYSSILVGYATFEKTPFDFIHWSELSIPMVYLASYWAMLVGIVILAIVFGVLILFAYGIYLIFELFENVIIPWYRRVTVKFDDNGEEVPATQVGVIYQNIKERFCNPIEWFNSKEEEEYFKNMRDTYEQHTVED